MSNHLGVGGHLFGGNIHHKIPGKCLFHDKKLWCLPLAECGCEQSTVVALPSTTGSGSCGSSLLSSPRCASSCCSTDDVTAVSSCHLTVHTCHSLRVRVINGSRSSLLKRLKAMAGWKGGRKQANERRAEGARKAGVGRTEGGRRARKRRTTTHLEDLNVLLNKGDLLAQRLARVTCQQVLERQRRVLKLLQAQRLTPDREVDVILKQPK